MLRPGTRVRKLTKKVGQHAAEGRIIGKAGHAYEVLWDDGHTGIADPLGVVKVKKSSSPKK
jgi:hypothetical protein